MFIKVNGISEYSVNSYNDLMKQIKECLKDIDLDDLINVSIAFESADGTYTSTWRGIIVHKILELK